MGVKGLDIICGVNESDPCSNVHYLSSSKRKGLDRIWSHDLCDTGIAQVLGSNSVQVWNFFFQALFLLLLKYCTLLRGSLSFMSLSAVQIYDLHIFLAIYILWSQFLIKMFFSLIFVGTLMFCWLVIHLLLSHRC